MSSPTDIAVMVVDVDEDEDGSESEHLNDEPIQIEDPVDEAAVEEPSAGGPCKHQRQRRTNSEVWQYFVQIEVKERGKLVQKLECLYCKQRYIGMKGGPTTSLGGHIKTCSKIKRALGRNQGLIKFEPDSTIPDVNPNGIYDQLKCREIIAKLIIAHELPFTFVEYQWFNILMKYINPLYQRVSRFTIKLECMKVFEIEKEKLRNVFKSVDRISLTSDCWTSNQTIGYMCLTAHYIDCDWKLQKRIISFNELAPPHSAEVISDGILESLIKWDIQGKIGAITLDNAANNDKATTILRSNFQARNKLHFDGLIFHVRCCAHILNLVVQDGLSVIDGCIVKIREGVKYLKKSLGRLLKFGEKAKTLGIDTSRSLCTDVKTRWNSTHRMLQSALYYKSTFHEYASRDSNFKWLPEEVEWINAEKVCKLLEVFLDATNLFSGSLYPTANLFLVEVFKVKKVIWEAYYSNDQFVRKMSIPMYEKFDKYWGEVGVLMSIASILDPRFKLLSVDYAFRRLYPIQEVDIRVGEVMSYLKSLFEKYSNEQRTARMAAKAVAIASHSAAAAVHTGRARGDNDFYAFLKSRGVDKPPKSDLEVYLEEPEYSVEEDVEFDVLKWWNQNSSKYPILSKLARDVLCIPVTTVASESAFSAGGRILDDYRSSLSKDMVEILVCGSDWIKATSKTAIKTLEQSAIEEENLEFEIPTSNDRLRFNSKLCCLLGRQICCLLMLHFVGCYTFVAIVVC